MFTSLKHTTCHTASQLVYDLVGIETQAIRKCSVRFGNRPRRAVNFVPFSFAKYKFFDSKRFDTLFGEVVRFDLEGICLDPLFPTHAKTMLPQTRFFTRERLHGDRGL